MAQTLEQILKDISANIDLSTDIPSGDELNFRVNVVNQSIDTWADSYQWRQLRQEITPDVAATNASVSLGSNFREFMAPPQVQTSSTTWDEFPEIMAEERYSMESSDKYCYVLGSPQGYYATFNNIASGASLSMVVQRYPSGVATLSDVSEVPDAQYIVLDATAKIMRARSDERFPFFENQATLKLQNMIGREQNRTPGGSHKIRRKGLAAYRIGTRTGV